LPKSTRAIARGERGKRERKRKEGTVVSQRKGDKHRGWRRKEKGSLLGDGREYIIPGSHYGLLQGRGGGRISGQKKLGGRSNYPKGRQHHDGLLESPKTDFWYRKNRSKAGKNIDVEKGTTSGGLMSMDV